LIDAVSRMIVSSFFWIRMRIKASLKNPVPDLNKNWEIIICSKDAMPWIRYLDTVLKGRGRSHSTWCGGGGLWDLPRGGSPWTYLMQGVGMRSGRFETDNVGGPNKICNLVCVSNVYWTRIVKKSIESWLTPSYTESGSTCTLASGYETLRWSVDQAFMLPFKLAIPSIPSASCLSRNRYRTGT
jgi:hypothetical protein